MPHNQPRRDCPGCTRTSAAFGSGDDGTQVVLSTFVTTLRSTRNGEVFAVEQGEIVLVTVKQYLAVADDLRSRLFPELPPSFWAHSGQYPSCSVCIRDDDCDATLH